MSPGILSDMLILHVLAYLTGVGVKRCISHATYSQFYLLYRASYLRNKGFTRLSYIAGKFSATWYMKEHFCFSSVFR